MKLLHLADNSSHSYNICSAIFFCPPIIPPQVLGAFVSQLFITTVYDAATYDSIIANDPTFPEQVYQDGYRLFVFRELYDFTNRHTCDLFLYPKNGLVSVLWNRFGKPSITLPIASCYLAAFVGLLRPPKDCHNSHKYEQLWNWEPTNNSDFNPNHLDPICARSIEPAPHHRHHKQVDHIVEPFHFDPSPFGSGHRDCCDDDFDDGYFHNPHRPVFRP